MEAVKTEETGKFSFTSSIKDDVWHRKTSVKSYEWWYFDALSDDGRDGVVIIFLDNFVFSPRYNSLAAKGKSDDGQQTPAGELNSTTMGELNPKSQIPNPESNVPAVAFVYYRDGKPCYRAYNEYSPEDFRASDSVPECRIGKNSFKFEDAPYGSGYTISINAKLRKNLNLEAHFEWLSIESDFTPERSLSNDESHVWNLVAPRSDVTGRITVSTDKGLNKDVIHFRGTGYHDHNLDNRWLPETVQEWQWGRAHFSDATAVFYRYKEHGENAPITKLFVVRHGKLRERDAIYEEQTHSRDKFGLKFPSRLRLVTEDNMRLRVKQLETIDSSFFYLRFLSEMTLTLRDGKPRKAIGFTEHLAPKTLKYRWLDFLVSMRIGRNGRGSFLP